MDGSMRGPGVPGSWAKELVEQLTAHQQRLRDLLALQRANLQQLQSELAALQQAEQQRTNPVEPLENFRSGPETPQGPGEVESSWGAQSPRAEQDSQEDLRQRYELALEDIRRLEAENQQLREQIERSRAVLPPSQGDGLESWEAFKRRVLAALDAEEAEAGEPTAQPSQQKRIQIEEVLAKTEALLAAKDQELESLRHLLENQSANLGAVAVGAAAVGQLLDQDEIIRQQRETLQRLEAEWREKLRQAEVELSLERAALARKQAELDEKLREVEELRTRLSSQATDTEAKKPPEGWRKFFGLPEGRKK
jgi:hypothetical protein